MVEKQSDYTGAADSVLNFYGVQLQSHAALAVGAFIGFFGVLQLAIANSPPSPKFLIVLPPVMAVLIFLVVYSVLRLIVYGSFANAILRKDMENCPSHREVSEQARTFYFENYRSMWRRILYGGENAEPWLPRNRRARWMFWHGGQQPRPIILVTIFAVSLGVSYWLIM